MESKFKKFKSVFMILMAVMLGLGSLSTVYGEDEAEYSTVHSDGKTTTMDMFKPVQMNNVDILSNIQGHMIYSSIGDYENQKPYLVSQSNVNLDVALLDEFVANVKTFDSKLLTDFEGFDAIYQSKGYIDTSVYQQMLTRMYTYMYDKYEYCTTFIEQHGMLGDDTGTIESYMLNVMMEHPYIQPDAYYALPYYDSDHLFTSNSTADFEALYDAVYAQVSSTTSDTLEAQKRTYEIMKQSIEEWIYEIDLDYFVAFQEQVKMYMINLKELGYVYDIASGDVRFSWDAYDPREIQLSDLYAYGHTAHMNINGQFLLATLNADGTSFISPEEIYNGEYIQRLVKEQVLVEFEQLDESDPASYSKENVLNLCLNSTTMQLNALSMPGAYAQPINNCFPMMIYEASKYYTEHGVYPDLTNWIEEGNTLTTYDIYRGMNYSKVPHVDLKEDVANDVTRTIHYQFEDGTKAAEDVVQTATFNVTTELISGKVIVDKENETLTAVANPTLTYQGATVLTPDTTVEDVVVNKDSSNIEVTVVYPLEFKLNVNYVDEAGVSLKDSTEIKGRWNTGYSETAPSIDGYVVKEVPTNASGTYGVDTSDVTFVYEKKKEDQKPTPDPEPTDPTPTDPEPTDPTPDNNDVKPSQPGVSAPSVAGNSVDTGDNTNVILLAILLAGSFVLIIGSKLRKKYN